MLMPWMWHIIVGQLDYVWIKFYDEDPLYDDAYVTGFAKRGLIRAIINI